MLETKRDQVLVIDDSPTARRLISDLLAKDYDVAEASDARDAIDKAAMLDEITVVVCDQKLPDGSGLDVLRHIRKLKPEAVGLLITAHSSVELLEESLNEDLVFRFIRKGGKPRTFLKAVSDCLERYKTRLMRQTTDVTGMPGVLSNLVESVFIQAPGLVGISQRLNTILATVATKEKPKWEHGLRMAGAVVFIGMLKVPMEIVRKVCAGEEIRPEEWEMFRKHAVHANEMLQYIPELHPAAPILAAAFGHESGHNRESLYVGGVLRAAYDAAWLERRIGTEGTLAILQRDMSSICCGTAKVAIAAVTDAMSQIDALKDGMDYAILSRTPGLLMPGDELISDLYSSNGSLLLSKGQRLTARTLDVIRELAREAKMPDTVDVVRVSAR